MRRLLLLTSVVALAACTPRGQEGAAEVTPTDAAAPEDVHATSEAAPPAATTSYAHSDFVGDWFGPEGLFANVALAGPGEYHLRIAGDLDAPAEGYEHHGRDAQGGIAFVRNGQSLLLKRATGDETGLRYLEGETDCLMVQDGEGFCRRQAGAQ